MAVVLIAVPFTILVLLVVAKSSTLDSLDTGVADRLHRMVLGRPGLAEALRVVSVATEPWLLRGIAVAAAAALWWRGRRRLAVWLLVTMGVGGLLGLLLKQVVARARPSFPDPLWQAGGYSFPSGHALNSMVFACCVLVLAHPVTRGGRRRALWAGAVGFVLLVGFDRIALGVHYVSDVVAGWIVALAIVAATVAAFATWRSHQGLSPSTADDGLDPQEAQP
jgi:undecaprenyl-diphosphatase